MHCGRSWGIWRDSSCKRPKWDSRYYLCVRVHSLEATFAPDTSRPHLDARRPDPSIEHGEEETLSVLRHLLLSSPRELLEELRPTVSSILLCCCYMTGGVLSSEWTNVHPHSPLPPPIHMFIYCTFYFVCFSCILSKPPKDTFPNAYTSSCGLFLSFLGKLWAHCLSCCMRCVQIIS